MPGRPDQNRTEKKNRRCGPNDVPKLGPGLKYRDHPFPAAPVAAAQLLSPVLPRLLTSSPPPVLSAERSWSGAILSPLSPILPSTAGCRHRCHGHPHGAYRASSCLLVSPAPFPSVSLLSWPFFPAATTGRPASLFVLLRALRWRGAPISTRYSLPSLPLLQCATEHPNGVDFVLQKLSGVHVLCWVRPCVPMAVDFLRNLAPHVVRAA